MAQVLRQFLAAHPNAIVCNRDTPGRLVGGNVDLKGKVPVKDLIFSQLSQTKLLQCIRGIGNQLPNEDFPVGVERMDNDIQQLPNFRMKFSGLSLRLTHDGN